MGWFSFLNPFSSGSEESATERTEANRRNFLDSLLGGVGNFVGGVLGFVGNIAMLGVTAIGLWSAYKLLTDKDREFTLSNFLDTFKGNMSEVWGKLTTGLGLESDLGISGSLAGMYVYNQTIGRFTDGYSEEDFVEAFMELEDDAAVNLLKGHIGNLPISEELLGFMLEKGDNRKLTVAALQKAGLRFSEQTIDTTKIGAVVKHILHSGNEEYINTVLDNLIVQAGQTGANPQFRQQILRDPEIVAALITHYQNGEQRIAHLAGAIAGGNNEIETFLENFEQFTGFQLNQLEEGQINALAGIIADLAGEGKYDLRSILFAVSATENGAEVSEFLQQFPKLRPLAEFAQDNPDLVRQLSELDKADLDKMLGLFNQISAGGAEFDLTAILRNAETRGLIERHAGLVEDLLGAIPEDLIPEAHRGAFTHARNFLLRASDAEGKTNFAVLAEKASTEDLYNELVGLVTDPSQLNPETLHLSPLAHSRLTKMNFDFREIADAIVPLVEATADESRTDDIWPIYALTSFVAGRTADNLRDADLPNLADSSVTGGGEQAVDQFLDTYVFSKGVDNFNERNARVAIRSGV